MDSSPPGSSVCGISQAGILEWVAISSAGDLLDPGFESTSPALAGRFFSTESSEKPNKYNKYSYYLKMNILHKMIL